MMNSVAGKAPAKRKNDDEVIDVEDEDGKENELRYMLLLKSCHRDAFKLKFEPIIQATGSTIALGGRDGTCWLITGYAAQGKGKPRASYQVYLDGRKVKVTVSGAKAAVILKLIQDAEKRGDKGDVLWPYQPDDEASHVCHSANCIRPDHITMENRRVNQSRNDCPGQVHCPMCDTSLDACLHNPPCIWMSAATRCSHCRAGL